MTHTLHRLGTDPEQLREDYVILVMPSKDINHVGSGPKLRRFFEIARGSAVECTAIQDVLEICGGIQPGENHEGNRLLDRISAMLTRLGGRGYSVKEDQAEYDSSGQDGIGR